MVGLRKPTSLAFRIHIALLSRPLALCFLHTSNHLDSEIIRLQYVIRSLTTNIHTYSPLNLVTIVSGGITCVNKPLHSDGV